MLKEFYVSELNIELPSWVRALPHSSALISSIIAGISQLFFRVNLYVIESPGNFKSDLFLRKKGPGPNLCF